MVTTPPRPPVKPFNYKGFKPVAERGFAAIKYNAKSKLLAVFYGGNMGNSKADVGKEVDYLLGDGTWNELNNFVIHETGSPDYSYALVASYELDETKVKTKKDAADERLVNTIKTLKYEITVLPWAYKPTADVVTALEEMRNLINEYLDYTK